MGRRKERRLAAMAAAGRRVKLDLFLDPSPGEESRKEGIGGENRDQQTVVPTSPYPSDKEENPLALLGQYSDDDEEDEGAADQPTGETKGSPRDTSVQVTDERVDIPSDKGDGHTELSVSVDDKQEAPQTGDIKNGTQSIAEENTVAPEPSLENESATATEAIPDSSGMQIVGDVGGNWKAVMHEQSSQCYYWNTVTGETSWEMPNGLTSGVASDGVTSTSVPTHMDYSIEAQAHVLPHNTLEAYPSDMSVVNGTANYATFGMECGSTQITHAYAYTAPAASHGSMDIDPLQLAKYGEDLLQRLKLLERLRGSNEGLELISREIGMRISDCNALSSYGSSLLPLWLHAEVHLKELDCSISKLETSYRSDTEPRHLKTETAEHKAPNEADMMAPSNDEDLKFEDSAGVHIDEKATIEEPASTSAAPIPQDMVVSAVPSKVEYDSDEDMDVEMEVDEDNVDEQQVHSSSVPNEEHPPSGKESTPNLPPLEGPAPPPEDNDVPPPPPEEEWIPPPPPDNEPASPPPMEEPVAPYVHVGTIPKPYIGQANVGYTLSGTEYYSAGSTEGTNGHYYIPATEAHVLQAQQHSYYAPVSASSMAVPVDGASIAAEPYYTYPSATMDASGVAAEHSVYYASSVSAISSSAVDTKTSSASLVSASSNSDPTGPDKVISKDASVAPSSEVTVATAAAGTVSMVGSSTQASSTTTQSKVIRSKKRAVAVTSSLRSNKKVSSLVDKWKAAKEELRDEEEEPESALEALERKRQKEIEEWRKQQIASGEAKENANFVPLRGDWRDRVKRRRAEAKKESEKESTAASLSSAEQHKGQPDLAELSKGLPSGWQAYLDESTKQVYYGNSLTSETRWERPTK